MADLRLGVEESQLGGWGIINLWLTSGTVPLKDSAACMYGSRARGSSFATSVHT